MTYAISSSRRLRTHQPCIRTRPEPLPVTLTNGVRPLRDQVRPFPGFRSCPASSSKTTHAPRSWAVLLPVTTAPSATAQRPARPARPPGARGPAATSPAGAADTTPHAGCTGARTACRSARPLWPASTAGPPSSRAPPAPLDVRAALPLSRQAPYQAYADFRDTRNLRATSGGRTPCSNIPAASKRTASRFARPAAVRPPPSAYLMTRM